MALYLENQNYALFTSKNLINWREVGRYRIEGTGECPDLFELPVDGDPKIAGMSLSAICLY